jgi:hypothetical protein
MLALGFGSVSGADALENKSPRRSQLLHLTLSSGGAKDFTMALSESSRWSKDLALVAYSIRGLGHPSRLSSSCRASSTAGLNFP